MKYYTAEELLELEGTIDEPSLDSTEEKALAEGMRFIYKLMQVQC